MRRLGLNGALRLLLNQARMRKCRWPFVRHTVAVGRIDHIARRAYKRLALWCLLLRLPREYSSIFRSTLQAVAQYLCNRCIRGNVRPVICGIRGSEWRRSWRKRLRRDWSVLRGLRRTCGWRNRPLSPWSRFLFSRNEGLKSRCCLFSWRFVLALGDQVDYFSGQCHDLLIAIVRRAFQETIAVRQARGTLLRFAS